MNLAQVARILSGFILFFSVFQVIPLLVAYYGEGGGEASVLPVRGFLWGMGAGLLAALLLWLAGRRGRSEFYRREGLSVVGFAWLLAGVLGAVPFRASGAMPTAADAFFESVSGLTTTGASVLGKPNLAIEAMPDSILLWRSMLQWMGGLGIIFVFIVMLPAMGVTGKNLLSSEQIGLSSENLRPRMQEQGRALFRIYVVLTVLAIMTYWLLGQTPFEATCHAFTTLSTGGFSPKNSSIAAYQSLPLELATILFMFLAGCNFAVLLSFTRSRFTKPRLLYKNPEFRLYFWLTLALVLGVTLILWFWGEKACPDPVTNTKDYSSFGRCLRDSAFNVVSIMTSTGFATADFQNWPGPALMILMFCMFVGGCSGSTAGGYKVVRLLVVHKIMAYHLRTFIRPKSVEKIRVGHDVIENKITAGIFAMLILWMGVVAIGTFALALDGRFQLYDCFTMNMSAFGCTGPAITAVDPNFELVNAGGIDVGPGGGYGSLYGWSKLLLSFQMILGRLELLLPLALLSPGLWKR